MLLLLFRALFGEVTPPAEDERGQFTRRPRRRAAQWSEYLGTPPRPATELVLDRGFRLEPRLGLGALSFAPGYDSVPMINLSTGNGRIDVKLGIAAPIGGARLGNGTVTWAANLFDDELAALLEIL